jgi:UDP-N-acetylmuramate--alanine ligase
MCALAEALVRAGLAVTGCDLVESDATQRLGALGVTVSVGHSPDHAAGIGTLVMTSAVPSDHPEIEAARRGGATVMKRAEALGRWVAQGRVIAIAGTHGKTTTTAMTAMVLAEADLDPTAFVGGRVSSWGGNLRAGAGDLFVVEADEYDRSFHALSPDVAVVTNVDADHLDIYGSASGVRQGFLEFLDGLRPNGRVVLCADDHGAASLVTSVGSAAFTYGLSAGTQLRGEAVRVEPGRMVCTVVEEGRVLGEMTVMAPGVHNLRNALAATAAARCLGVGFEAIRAGLASFPGVSRRFERLGSVHGVTVIDDYAHHPTEVRATLAAARAAFPDHRLVAVFQPHLYSRTRDFSGELGTALAAADLVWVTDIYPAREAPIPGVTGKLVADAMGAENGGEVRYVEALDDLVPRIVGALADGDLVVTLGAGSIEAIGPAILEELSRSGKPLGESIHA